MPHPTPDTDSGATGVRVLDALVVGAGFAGLYALHLLRGQGKDVHVVDGASDVGGTWYWNRYPGARCDIESVYYCFSFDADLAREWTWTEKYASQPEILAYLRHVAERYDLRRDISFDTWVHEARYDETADRWQVTTHEGRVFSARYLVLASGLLSSTNLPEIPGRDDFAGPVLHTGRWPHEPVDFTGQRVGVIGTGSSGIQVIPEIAAQASHLTVFQRTPNFSLPARNGSPHPEKVRDLAENHEAVKEQLRSSSYGIILEPPTQGALEVGDEERLAKYETRWQEGTLTGILQAYNDLVRNQEANDTAADFVRNKIAEIVNDPDVAADLMPYGYAYGTKRPCLDSGYYATYNHDNVKLVNLRRTPFERITPSGVRTTAGEVELDALVFATGYDAMTGPLLAIDPIGRKGKRLSERWAEGATSYLGIAIAGFPNMFTITGPGSPSALSNAVISIEQHVEWVADLLANADEHDRRVIEADDVAEKEWTQHVQVVGNATLYPKTDSWYMGANIPGKPRVFLPYIGGVGNYRAMCDQIAADGYRGFTFV